MIALNLDAVTPDHNIIKQYLEENASEALAEKINGGVRVEKDGKTLLNKKTLETFMQYSCEEARKSAEKGARYKCVDHDTVFGWAVHYFEEDSIEGILYSEDGTEYKPPKPVAKPYAKPAVAASPAAPKPMTLFDMMNAKPAAGTETSEITEQDAEETEEPQEDLCADESESPAPPALIQIGETKYVDENGVIHEVPVSKAIPKTETEPKLPDVLVRLFGGTLIAR